MNKKNSILGLFSLVMVVALCIGFVSCSEDNDNNDPNNGQSINPDTPVKDPVGTVILSMRNENSGKTYLDNIYIDKADNFMSDWGTKVEFVSLGKVNGLGNVANIPLEGWANKMSCIPGYGYVAYNRSEDMFYRLYVMDYVLNSSQEIIGAEIKYQKPFKGLDEAIVLPSTTISFPYKGGYGELSEDIFFENKNILVFSIESNQTWCHVNKTSNNSNNFLYNGINITCEPNYSSQAREAEIKLTTAYDKSVTINVNQSIYTYEGNGTAESPFTVADAINYAKEVGDKESDKEVYIKGKVSTIMEQYGAQQYGSATFNISEDGTANNEFTVYRAFYLGNKRYTFGDLLYKGDEVIVCGKVTCFNGNTPETVQGKAYLYSLNDKTEASGGTAEYPFTVADAIHYAKSLGQAESENQVYIKGFISAITEEYTTKLGNGSFVISDTKEGTNKFTVYHAFYLGNKKFTSKDTQIRVGDEVIVCGKVTCYKGNGYTPEMVEGKAYLYSLNGKTEANGGDETPDTPAAEVKTVTVAEFNAASESTNVWYQLTGTISNLKDGDLYGNFDLEDETGTVYVYGLLSEKGGAKKLFQELVAAKGIKNGSTITIIGNRGSYNDKIEVTNAYFVSVSN